MTKSELTAEIAKRVPQLSVREAAKVVQTFFDAITEALARGERVEIRSFGVFKAKQRGARVGRNPKTGETVHVPAKKVPYFKPGKELKQMVDR
jgi:integration host factor subunit beta